MPEDPSVNKQNPGLPMPRIDRTLAALRHVNQLITHAQDECQLLQGICDGLVNLMGYPSVWIARLDSERQFITASASGLGEAFDGLAADLARGAPPRCVREALDSTEVVFTRSAATDCDPCALQYTRPGHGILTAPLLAQEELFGVLSVSAPVEVLDNEEEQHLLAELADDVACAVKAQGIIRERDALVASLNKTAHWIPDPITHFRLLPQDGWPVQYVNKVVGRYNYQPQEFGDGGKTFSDIIHPDDLEMLRGHVAAAIDSGQQRSDQQFRLIAPSGNRRWVHGLFFYERNAEGELVVIECRLVEITLRKFYQERLRFQTILLDQLSDFITVTDMEGRIRFANQPVCEAMGQSLGELRGQHVSIYGESPEQGARQQEIVENTIRHGEWRCEVVNRGTDGRKIVLDCRTRVLHDEEGETTGLCGISTDITEQKRMHDALRESEARYRDLFDNMLDGFALHEMVYDESGNAVDYRYLQVNPAFERLTGIQGESLVGKTVLEVMPETEAYWIELYAKVVETGEPVRYENAAREIGKYFQVYAFRPTEGQFAVVFQDVSERRKAEEELRRVEWMLSREPDALTSGNADASIAAQGYGDLTTLNADGLIARAVEPKILKGITSEFLDLLQTSAAIYERNGDYALGIFSSGWCRQLDQASRQLCGTEDNVEALTCGKWLCHESCWTRCSRVVMETGHPVDIACNGGIRLYAEPILAGGEVIGSINFGYGDPPTDEASLQAIAERYGVDAEQLAQSAANYDSRPPFIIEMAKKRLSVSARLIGTLVERHIAEQERDQLETRLRQSEKMDAIGQLAGGIAHDFNNQLAGIMGYADLLAARLDDEHLKRHVESILTSTHRAADLTRQLLAFARKGQYLSAQVHLHSTVHEVVEILQHTIDKRITIEQILKASSDLTQGDPSQLQNVLLNLALNARDAMPEGGTMTFESATVELDNKAIREMQLDIPAGWYVRLDVRDTGCGIDEDTIRHMFEPFFTTKPVGKGTGMGLASVYGAVRNHKGAVHVRSTPGEGSRFRIFLPLSHTRLQTAPTSAGPPPLVRPGRILVVDDEPVFRKVATAMLEEAGHQVASAADGAECVAYYKEHWRETDLILLDMIMPEMNGKTAFFALRQINPDVRVLLASGYSFDGATQDLLGRGVHSILHKPFSKDELLGAVARALYESDSPPTQA